jgi:CBS domain-containing protein
VVASNGEFQGILTIQDLRRLPRNKWLTSSVGQVMIAKERLRVVSPLEEALSLLESMDQQRLTHMPVAEDGRIIGVVGREEVMRFLQTRAELKV